MRLYHEKGIIQPHAVDERTPATATTTIAMPRKARSVRLLKRLELPLDEIAQILRECRQDADALEILDHHRAVLEGRSKELQKAKRLLNSIIDTEREAIAMTKNEINEIVEKIVPDIRIAGSRWKGATATPANTSAGFAGSWVGTWPASRSISTTTKGSRKKTRTSSLACPLREGGEVPGVRRHFASRDSRREDRIFAASRTVRPTRPFLRKGLRVPQAEELYRGRSAARDHLKGPGMIFKGDPKKYLTEIQFPISG